MAGHLVISKRMKQLPSFVIFYCLLIYSVHTTEAAINQETLATRLLEFGDVRAGKVLATSALRMIFKLTVQQCALECVRTLNCRSFNLRGRQTCELNRDDVFSIGVKNQHLLKPDSNAVYYGMKQDFVPLCKHEGVSVLVVDVEGQEICHTQGKRVDREWSNWEDRTNTTGDDYFDYRWREILVDYAHGGIAGEQHSTIMLQHLKIVKVAKDWWAAKSHCESVGGKFFSNLDGTVGELIKLLNLQGGVSFWLGLQLSGGHYRDVDGAIFPWGNIRWASGKPDQTGEIHLAVITHINTIDDMPSHFVMPFFCDML